MFTVCCKDSRVFKLIIRFFYFSFIFYFRYFKMITFFCEIHPEKVCTLPAELLQQLLVSVELGLFSFGNEVTNHCCDIIQVMAKHIYSEVEKGRPRNEIMAPFMNVNDKNIFRLTLHVNTVIDLIMKINFFSSS